MNISYCSNTIGLLASFKFPEADSALRGGGSYSLLAF